MGPRIKFGCFGLKSGARISLVGGSGFLAELSKLTLDPTGDVWGDLEPETGEYRG